MFQQPQKKTAYRSSGICLRFTTRSSCHCSVSESCLTLFDSMDCSAPGSSVLYHLQSLLRFRSIESVMLSNHLILCHPLLLVPSIFPSIRIFSNELALRIRWPKYWSLSLSFSSSPSNEYSGLISFRIDCFDLLAVQGTLKSLLQHHNLKASIFQCSPFFYGPTLTSAHDYWKKP